MKNKITLLLLLGLLLTAGSAWANTNTATASATSTYTYTATATATASATATNSATATASATSSATATPTATVTNTFTFTLSATPSMNFFYITDAATNGITKTAISMWNGYAAEVEPNTASQLDQKYQWYWYPKNGYLAIVVIDKYGKAPNLSKHPIQFKVLLAQ